MNKFKILMIVSMSCLFGSLPLGAMFTKQPPRRAWEEVVEDQAPCRVRHGLRHLAIIPDGNRRWAQAHARETLFGHHVGMEKFQVAIAFCLENSIPELSLYAFSLENFNRTEEEQKYLFGTLMQEFSCKVTTFVEKGVRVRFVGDRTKFPAQVMPVVADLENRTQHCSNLSLYFLFCYGGESDMVHAAQEVARKVLNRELRLEDITAETFKGSLWTVGISDPDLIIRTGAENQRLSGFYMPQSAYTELMFLPFLWPDITQEILNDCFIQFKNIKRNFGK